MPTGLVLAGCGAVIGGMLVAAQGPVYARLSEGLNRDPLASVFIAFLSATLVTGLLALLLGNWRSLSAAGLAALPPWVRLGGLLGAFHVMISMPVIPLIGVSVFLVLVIVRRHAKPLRWRHEEPSHPAWQGRDGMHDEVSVPPSVMDGRRQVMRLPDEVAAMLRLHGLGWGTRRIAAELGCDRETVRRYVAAGGWAAYRGPGRPNLLAGHEAWLAERFRRHRGNADVVRQELAGELRIRASLRTVERAVVHLRRELTAEALATVRFETPPGRQLQIDFGEIRTSIEGEDRGKLHLFVATLGYSRRVYVRAFRHERQSAWLDGIEGAFRHFGGLPAELLMDNAKALVTQHDAATREVVFNDRLHSFAQYWGVRPVACAPYRARTKGKDERGVGYVKGNAIAGRSFASWSALEAHLAWWMREVADMRVHGTTGEVPAERFAREEQQALRPLAGRPSFRQMRELTRRVQNDACVDVDTNHYSVPWQLIGAHVSVVISNGAVRVHHAGVEVACHEQRRGRRERAVDRAHLHGVLARSPDPLSQLGDVAAMPDAALPGTDLLRPLTEYEQVAGGGW